MQTPDSASFYSRFKIIRCRATELQSNIQRCHATPAGNGLDGIRFADIVHAYSESPRFIVQRRLQSRLPLACMVAHHFRFSNENDIFRDIGGMVGQAFDMTKKRH